MKKVILLSAMCAIALASCSKTELTGGAEVRPADPNEIHITSTTTRGTTNTLANLQAGFIVYVTSGTATNDWYTNLSGATYKYNATTEKWGWESTPTPTWPTVTDGYPMNFYGIYPSATISSTTVTALTQTITVGATVASQVDHLASQEKIDTKPLTSQIPMAFYHITSKVNFGIQTGKTVTAYVNKLSINNITSVGTYNYVATSSAAWTVEKNSNPLDYVYFTSTEKSSDMSNTVTDKDQITPIYKSLIAQNLMLIPQTTTSWDPKAVENRPTETTDPTGAYIGMNYRLSQSDDANTVGYELRATCTSDTKWTEEGNKNAYDKYKVGGLYSGPLYVKVGFPMANDDFEWTKGKGYMYNIMLGTFEGTGGLYLSKYYYDETGANTMIIVDGNPNITDPVGGGTIGFDVTVRDWETDVPAVIN